MLMIVYYMYQYCTHANGYIANTDFYLELCNDYMIYLWKETSVRMSCTRSVL